MSVQPDLEHRIAEVVESSSALFVAQCYELYETPPLGTLVRAGENPVTYGVITKITTLGTDPTRRPVARGATELNESAVYANNPQLSRLLRTDFETVIVGYGDGGDIKHYLPPIPPRIHAFVYTCTDEELKHFMETFRFLEALIIGGASDDSIAACLRQASHLHDDAKTFLIRAGRELAELLMGQLPRLQSILRKLDT